MLRFIKQKIKNQLWLSICLVLGLSFLIAIFTCQALFQKGALNELLRSYITQGIENHGDYPTQVGVNDVMVNIDWESFLKLQEELESYHEEWAQSFQGIPVVNQQSKFSFFDDKGRGYYDEAERFIRIAYMPELEKHIQIVDGIGLDSESMGLDSESAGLDSESTGLASESAGRDQEGNLYCILTDKVMDVQEYVLGEKIIFNEIVNQQGKPLVLTIAGVYAPSDRKDTFWCVSPYESEGEVYVSQESFRYIMENYSVNRLYYDDRILLDQNVIDSTNFGKIERSVDAQRKENKNFFCHFQNILDRFSVERWQIILMLVVLEIPILGMIFPFIYMVSAQISQREQVEIATLKSRGITRKQVIFLYFLRALTLGGIALFVGIPFGRLLCNVAASATNFLTFAPTDTSEYALYPGALLFGLAADCMGIVCIMLPVFSYSKVSIVEIKSGEAVKKKMLWEKLPFDIILMGISVYLVFFYSQYMGQIQEEVDMGDWTDPLVFLNACLFVIAAGIFSFRLMQYFVRLVYRIGQKKWKTVAYTSFLQITRTSRKQMFISIFMIATVSLGLFYANAARTMNRNLEERTEYRMAADVQFKEAWKGSPYQDGAGNKRVHYEEPDYDRFAFLTQEGLCESYTRVLVNDNVDVGLFGDNVYACRLQAIDVQQFGQTVQINPAYMGEKHWYHNLNALALQPEGVIISRNLADTLHVNEGGIIRVDSYRGAVRFGMPYMYCPIVAIVDAWPGYEPENTKGEQYLVVMNLPLYLERMETYPYEVWVDLKEGVDEQQLQDALEAHGISITKYETLTDRIASMKSTFIFQVTNGLFSLSFLIAVTLCGVGFLIYWTSSISQRELLFGVYRAMGMSVKEINRMLLYEHFFSTFLSVLSGGIVGMATTFLFAELFAVVYLPEKSVVSVNISFETMDMVRLALIILGGIILCLFVLRRQIKKLNISQALKLGED